MSAHTALFQALGYQDFGLSEARCFLHMAGVGWEDDPAVAAKIVELWLSTESRGLQRTRSWTVDLLQEAHTAVHEEGTPNAESFASSSLYRLLTTSQDPVIATHNERPHERLRPKASAMHADLRHPSLDNQRSTWDHSTTMTAEELEIAIASSPPAKLNRHMKP